MKLHRFEKLLMNNPVRVWVQRKFEVPKLFKRVILPINPICLEVGCGRGVGALLINEHFNCKKVFAIDFDEDMIEKAKRYLANPPKWAKGIRSDNIILTQADASDLPFTENFFDAIFAFGVFHHIENWQKAILGIHKVLKIGGYFAFEEFFFESPILRLNLWLTKKFGTAPYVIISENRFEELVRNLDFDLSLVKRDRIPMPHWHAVIIKR